MKNKMIYLMLATILSFTPITVQAQIEIYFIRHAEVDLDSRDKPLLNTRKQRAIALASYFKDKEITHLFATHFDRNRDTAMPLSIAQDVELVQIPRPGSLYKDDEVTSRTKAKTVKPILKKLKALTDDSIAVVVGNSGNLFKIMSKYGIDDLPCQNKKCFPRTEFDNMWIVTNDDGDISVTKTRY